MKEKRIGIIMNGVTGRMGLNQHLVRSILAIRIRVESRLRTDAANAGPNPGGPKRSQAGADCQGSWRSAMDNRFEEER